MRDGGRDDVAVCAERRPAGRTGRHGLLIATLGLALGLGACQGQRPAVVAPAPVAAPAAPAVLTMAELEAWRASRAWTSQEELLQFFADNDAAFRTRGVVVEASVLARMSTEMHSMFPLAACTRISYQHGGLRIALAGPQHVKVPGGYHQAFLALPARLDFQVAPPTANEPVWHFHVVDSRVRLEFSWLAKLFGPIYLRDFDVDDLEYRLDRVRHSSTLGVHNTIHRLANGTMVINGHPPVDAKEIADYLVHFITDQMHETDPVRQQHAPMSYREDYAFNLETRHLSNASLHYRFDDRGLPPDPLLALDPPSRTPH